MYSLVSFKNNLYLTYKRDYTRSLAKVKEFPRVMIPSPGSAGRLLSSADNAAARHGAFLREA
jgi:hypothetical protein